MLKILNRNTPKEENFIPVHAQVSARITLLNYFQKSLLTCLICMLSLPQLRLFNFFVLKHIYCSVFALREH